MIDFWGNPFGYFGCKEFLVESLAGLFSLSAGPSNTVLYVCTGNICRSAFAQEYSKRCLNSSRFEFASAGTHAVVGHGMDQTVLQAAAVEGVTESDHVARQLTGRILKSAAIVIVFDRHHLDWITQEFPEHLSKVYSLRHLATALSMLPAGVRVNQSDLPDLIRRFPLGADDDGEWIRDPYRQGQEAAAEAVSQIAAALRTLGEHLY